MTVAVRWLREDQADRTRLHTPAAWRLCLSRGCQDRPWSSRRQVPENVGRAVTVHRRCDPFDRAQRRGARLGTIMHARITRSAVQPTDLVVAEPVEQRQRVSRSKLGMIRVPVPTSRSSRSDRRAPRQVRRRCQRPRCWLPGRAERSPQAVRVLPRPAADLRGGWRMSEAPAASRYEPIAVSVESTVVAEFVPDASTRDGVPVRG